MYPKIYYFKLKKSNALSKNFCSIKIKLKLKYLLKIKNKLKNEFFQWIKLEFTIMAFSFFFKFSFIIMAFYEQINLN